MGEGNGNKAREISLGEGFGDVALRVNGATIEVHADGSIDAYTERAVKIHPAANDASLAKAASSAEPKPGDRMADGTIYAGASPDTGKPMYATPADAPLSYSFNDAQKFAKGLTSKRRTATTTGTCRRKAS